MDGRYYCELAWLGGDAADGRRRASTWPAAHHQRRRPAWPSRPRARCGWPASPCRAWPTPTATPSTGRCAGGRSPARDGTGSFWTWREQMYGLAEALDARQLPRPGPRRVRRDGAGRHHRRRRVPLPPPRHRQGSATPTRTRWAAPSLAAAADAGLRLTLLDTCYLHGGIGAEPEGVQRRFSDGTAAAWAERAAALDALAGPGLRIGAAIHSVRAVDPAVDGGGGGVGRRARRPAPRPRVRAAGRERATASPPTACTPTALLARTRRARASGSRPSTPPTSPTPTSTPLGAAPLLGVLLPDDRARPGRRHRPGPAAASTPEPG